MKKLILAVLLVTASFTSYAQEFVAAKTEVGKDVVIVGDKFYFTPGDGTLKVCKDAKGYTGTETGTDRPFYSILATCGKEVVAIKQYKDEKGGELLLIINIKTNASKAFPVIILKGDMI